MKSVVRRFGLWTIVVCLLLSAVGNVIFMDKTAAAANPEFQDATVTKIFATENACVTMQGGASDGTYFYFTCRLTSDDKNHYIYKYTLDGKKVKRSAKFTGGKLGHANDMTYNSNLKKLVVVHQNTEGKFILVDPETLDPGTAQTVNNVDTGRESSKICYRASTNQYLINSKLFSGDDFSYQETVPNTKFADISRALEVPEDSSTEQVAGQGFECDESNIYNMRVWYKGVSHAGKPRNRLAVTDWSGNVTGRYNVVNNDDEGEWLARVGNDLYMGFNVQGVNGGYVTKVSGVTIGSGAGGARALNLGSYNVHGPLISEENETGCQAAKRFGVIAKNIQTMGMDVVGLQEFTDFNEAAAPNCNGKQVKLLDFLNSSGEIWKVADPPSEVDKNNYSQTQAAIIYNSTVVDLASYEVKNVSGGSDLGSWPGGLDCGGGSPAFHIGGFSDSGGKTFYVANGNWCANNADQRAKDTAALVGIMTKYSGAKFVVGNTNSQVGQEVEKVMGVGGYGDSRLTAAQKTAAEFGTLKGAGKGNNIIDRIYYHKETVKDPSEYVNLNCKKSATCGSTHRPIRATFPSVMVGGTADECVSGNQREVFDMGIPYYNVNSCVCVENISSDSSTAGDTTAEQAFSFLISTPISTNGGKPLSAAQAAGAVGNLMVESGGNTFDLDPEAVNSIGASGVAQWLGGRKTSLKKFASEKGTDWTDFKTQLEFIIEEIENSEKAIMKDSAFQSVSNDDAGARIAAERWDTLYERSGGAGIEKRKNNASKAFEAFGDNAPGSSLSGGGSANCPATSSAADGSQQALIDKVKEFAWDDGRRVSEQKEAYTAALKGRYKGGNNGNDCGAFVSTLMVKSGFEPDYPGTSTSGQKPWLDSHWEKIAGVGEVDVANLQPGDVGIVAGSHVFVWVGDVDGFVGKSAEAALGSNTAPTGITKNNTFSLPSKYNWYRKK